jgi:hypothetical protein
MFYEPTFGLPSLPDCALQSLFLPFFLVVYFCTFLRFCLRLAEGDQIGQMFLFIYHN